MVWLYDHGLMLAALQFAMWQTHLNTKETVLVGVVSLVTAAAASTNHD